MNQQVSRRTLRADAIEKVRGMSDERNDRIQRRRLVESNLRISRSSSINIARPAAMGLEKRY
jgi:hypothetical protein